MDYSKLTATELVAGIARGDYDALAPANFFLDRIARSTKLNAFVATDGSPSPDTLLANLEARQNENTTSNGPLAGLPIAIKDGICTDGILTTAGSKMLGAYIPPYDATCIEQLNATGAWTIGKTNMDEFAMGSSTENSTWGPSRNPFDLSRVPGGSSGGSAVAVAAGLAPCALGSDTGGSIRQPAAFCGITGLKPTYGRVSRRGLIAFASSLDQIGPMARTAQDCALLMNVLAGHDPLDSTSSQQPTQDYVKSLEGSIEGLKVGVCREHFSEGLDPAVAQAVQASLAFFESHGATLVDIKLPHASLAVATYYVIAPCEASSNLSRYDGVRFTYRHSDESLEAMYCQSRGEGFGAEVARRILLGTFALSSGYYDAYYLQASKVRRLIKNDFDTAFQQVDLIAGPTTPTTAFPLGANSDDPLAMYLADIYTVSANLAGIPAISLPCGIDPDGLPIGLQLQGKPFAESTLLNVADFFQQQTDYHQQRPDEAWLESEASS